MIAHAKTDEGLFLFELLHYIGLSLPEYLRLDPRQVAFYQAAFAEKNKRQNEEMKRSKMRRRR